MAPSAQDYATLKHECQRRRDGTPYISHPSRVVQHVCRVMGLSKDISEIKAAAWLHDTLEDTDATFEDIKELFGDTVAELVRELTSDKHNIAKVGKTAYLQQKLNGMSNHALVIKLADRLDNVSDLINADDPQWARKYTIQTQDILHFLVDHRELTDPQLSLVNDINDVLKGLPYL
ncbi:hypothetical protein P9112_012737 [Eukaryota sp. TZLM1-RC]